MSSFPISPPEGFNFIQDDWPRWIRRFERFRKGSGLQSKSEENQVNALIYVMGDKADDILNSFGLSDDERKVYRTVKEKFDDYFEPKRNVIFQRAKFNQRKQLPGESVDDFITDLHCLADRCNYGDLRNEMVRDRIVVGLLDGALSEKLQLDANLTMETAVTAARQSEGVHKQQSVVRGKSTVDKTELVDTVDAVNSAQGVKKRFHHKQVAGNFLTGKTPVPQQKVNRCPRCGKSPNHSRYQCPAKDAICHRCRKKGHYQAMCTAQFKQVNAVTSTEPFLGVITDSNNSSAWNVTLSVNGTEIEFKLDTGADVSAIPDHMLNSLKVDALLPASTTLTGAGNQPLQVCGQFEAKLQYKSQCCKQVFYVVTGLCRALLGRPAIEALNLIARLDLVEVDCYKAKYPELFSGLGSMEGEHKITLKPGYTPFAIVTPRRVPLPLMPKVKEELDRMEHMGVISRVHKPTEWCAGIVVVPKQSGNIRICVDLTQLNKNVCRERHVIPSVDSTLAQLSNATVFTKLDANSGFWQIRLAKESRHLTTFITPFGRFCFNRLPFGITSAPEYFQKKMSQLLEGLDGVVCMMDDVLIYGQNQAEHDRRVDLVLQKFKAARVTLNEVKCQFSQKSVKFLGHLIDSSGVHPDPDKVQAIIDMQPPTNVHEVRRFLGMVQQMGKFSPNLADKTKPLRDLLSLKNQWAWTEHQQQAFEALKRELSSRPVLALYNPNADTLVAADASSFGLGAVLTQKQDNDEWLPIAYVSRALTPTERRYAQIEKEALAITYACERFQEYLIGKSFHINTDHKPLVPIFSSKSLDELPLRVQRFRLRLLRFQFSISHTPGKKLITADTLSRAPLQTLSPADSQLQDDCDAYVVMTIGSLPATEPKLKQIKKALKADDVCKQVMQFCNEGWPDRVDGSLKQYFPVRLELSVHDGLLLKGNQLVIPSSMQSEIIHCLHAGHQGITKCRARAKTQCGGQDLENNWRKQLLIVKYVVNSPSNLQSH